MLQQEFWSSSAKTALLGQMCCKISAKEGLHIKLTLCILPVGSDSGPKVELSYCRVLQVCTTYNMRNFINRNLQPIFESFLKM